jgi:Domain of unknown function (DUF4252)
MKTLAAAAVLAALISAPAMAQKLDLNFASVAAKATEKTEIDLEGPALALAKAAISSSAGADHQSLYADIDGIAVRSYEFASTGQYSERDLDGLRKQVTDAAGWTRMLKTQDTDDDTEIYIRKQGDKTNGFLLITAEPKELTVVHISGTVDLAKMQELIQSTIRYTASSQ